MNINISCLKNHFFCKKIDEYTNIDKNNKKKTKIVNYCFYSINEAKISDKIKKIPYYSNYYSIVTSYDFINIRTIKEHLIENVKLDENKKYLLFTYLPFFINFGDFLMQFKEPKLLILNMITSFSYILQSLIQLQDQNI